MASNLKLDARVRFNSRSREGSDITAIFINRERVGFNSRSREGSDMRQIPDTTVAPRFNSRSREGSDAFSPFRPMESAWFQFALPRGERHLVDALFPAGGSFNSRSREGSDSAMLGRLAKGPGFNSRSREGSDDILWQKMMPR